jgi:hypothetical protein
LYCLVFSTSFFLLYLPIRLVEVVLLVVALSSSSSSLPSFLLPPLPFLLPFCSLFLPVYTTTCDSTKKKRKRTGLHTLYGEHRICRELKSAQQAKSDGSPSSSSSSNNNSNTTATRARRHTSEGKRELRQAGRNPHVPENYYFYEKKKCPIRFTLLLFLFTPLATLFYTVCSYSKA